MAGWRHWPTKYTDKESTVHYITTFHTTISPMISSSYTLVGKISTFTDSLTVVLCDHEAQ